MSSTENVVTDKEKQGWLAVHFDIRGNSLSEVGISTIGISIVSGISKVSISSIPSIQKVGVSFWLGISGTLSIKSVSKTKVSKTRVPISKTMSIVSSIQKVGVSISLRLSFTLANIRIS